MTCRGGETRRKGSQTPQRQEMRKIGEMHLEDPPPRLDPLAGFGSVPAHCTGIPQGSQEGAPLNGHL